MGWGGTAPFSALTCSRVPHPAWGQVEVPSPRPATEEEEEVILEEEQPSVGQASEYSYGEGAEPAELGPVLSAVAPYGAGGSVSGRCSLPLVSCLLLPG